jgi:hypothetical protein
MMRVYVLFSLILLVEMVTVQFISFGCSTHLRVEMRVLT